MQPNLAERVRGDFPILATTMDGKPLVYLDNGATTQKPQVVIDAISDYYSNDNANIHRGLYALSQRATDRYESARDTVASFLGAPFREECLFVRGTTEGVNLVAYAWGNSQLKEGDEIIVSGLEHHSNIVPWQLACERSGAKLHVWRADDDGKLAVDDLDALLNERTRMVAIQHVSNALGTIHDAAEICRHVKDRCESLVLIDGAQWVAHHETRVEEIGCDFYTFSGHKLFGPTGIGVLWGKREILESMPPYQGGGDMIETVSFEGTTYAPLPNRFEAGTPDIAGVIGLQAAIEYVESIGLESIAAYEDELLEYASSQLATVPGLRILGPDQRKAAVISFVLEDPSIAPMDITTHLSNHGIAIRTGHHCCMPLMGQLHVTGTSRASFAFYNTLSEVDLLVESLQELVASRSASKASVATQESAEITFAPQKGEGIAAVAGELAEEFLEFDDAESKTELLMELGGELPDCFEPLKAISTPVPGCMSEVYLVGRPVPDAPERFEFSADSNAAVVRGLIAVLQQLFSGQQATDILQYDIESFFRKIGLHQFVSTQRRSGLDGMIKRIRTLAQAITERQSA